MSDTEVKSEEKPKILKKVKNEIAHAITLTPSLCSGRTPEGDSYYVYRKGEVPKDLKNNTPSGFTPEGYPYFIFKTLKRAKKQPDVMQRIETFVANDLPKIIDNIKNKLREEYDKDTNLRILAIEHAIELNSLNIDRFITKFDELITSMNAIRQQSNVIVEKYHHDKLVMDVQKELKIQYPNLRV